METIKQIICIALFMMLPGCSHFNVSSDWDCPKQAGVGCITIYEADSMAIAKAKGAK